MSTDLIFATARRPRAVRFVVVNNRAPCVDQHCALCGSLIEQGYVRDSQTRLIYCNTQCLSGWTRETVNVESRGRITS